MVSEYGISAVRPVRAGNAWLGLGPQHAVYVAATAEGARGLRMESTRRAWAASLGIDVPLSLHEEPGLVVTERVPADPLTQAACVDAAQDVVQRLTAAVEWPQGGFEASRGRRARRPWTVPARLLRGVSQQVPWPEFRAVRAEASRLPADTVAHGDFQDDNLLWSSSDGRLRVVDWEYAGQHPAGTDLLNLWVQLPWDDLRPALLEAAQRSVGSRSHVAVLAHWLALRHLAEVATGRPGEDGRSAWRGRLENARASLARARALRTALGGGA